MTYISTTTTATTNYAYAAASSFSRLQKEKDIFITAFLKILFFSPAQFSPYT
jgi:hypothetical protein